MFGGASFFNVLVRNLLVSNKYYGYTHVGPTNATTPKKFSSSIYMFPV